MKLKKIIFSTISILLLVVATATYFLLKPTQYTVAPFWLDANEASVEQVNHSEWQYVLDEYLITDDSSGINRMDYESLLEDDEERLIAYVDYLSQLDPRQYSRDEQFAYWVNLYNALTVKLILQHYPIDSITKLGKNKLSFGPWDDPITTIVDQTLSLNDIEHRILRPTWKDYRIHFAVNCASNGCPDLQPTAYTQNTIESLLNQAATDYLKHPRGVKFEGEKLILSSIFDWYKEDFGRNTKQLLQTLSKHLEPEMSERLKTYKGTIHYEYDWGLNGL